MSSMKTGLVLMIILVIILVIGPFVEGHTSYDYVQRLIYHSWPNRFLFIVITFNISFSILVRIPLRRRLFGFYVIHGGILLLFLGVAVHYYAGIDGQMSLNPGEVSNKVDLNKDVVVKYSGKDLDSINPVKYFLLPYTSFEKNIDKNIDENIIIKKYLPYSNNSIFWKTLPSKTKYYSMEIAYKNAKEQGFLILSRFPDSPFEAQQQILDNRLLLLPPEMLECFKNVKKNNFFFWNITTKKCFIPKIKLKTQRSKLGNLVVNYNYEGKDCKYYPFMTPRAMAGHGKFEKEIPLMLFSREFFKKSGHVLFFDSIVVTYNKFKETWEYQELLENWQVLESKNIQIKAIRHGSNLVPIFNPKYFVPRPNKQTFVSVKLQNKNEEHWLTTNNPLVINTGSGVFAYFLEKQSIVLPFKIALDKFILEMYEESKRPKSYQSEVSIIDDKIKKITIGMNSPLSYGGFRFYQSSYYKASSEKYGSVLSVNLDPGRWMKYLGSVLLTIGLIFYYLTSKKGKR